MSISTEILRIQTATNTLRNKGVEIGVCLTTDKLDVIAEKYDEDLVNQGAISVTVQEGDTYNIPQGYHNGAGTVSGVAGGGNYTLQSKTVTPTKSSQAVVTDSGYYGLSDVTVNPIPSAYQDVSSVTATASDVLANKIIVDSNGDLIVGAMTNNGNVDVELNTSTTSYTIPAGYHVGEGEVSITTETKTATPTESSQTISPSTGSVLSSVTVNAIPSDYTNVSTTDGVESDVLYGVKVANSTGVITGTMANNGAVTETLDTNTTSYTIPVGYHSGAGEVSITTETKTATPTESSQTISPSTGSVLSSVTVNAIPSDYTNVSTTDGVESDVLYGVKVANSTGVITGTMANNGAVTETLDTNTTSYTIPVGYHSGAGEVSITTETKSATPSTSAQTITPTDGNVLSSVSVGAIPSQYKDTTGTTAVAGNILAGVTAVNTTGTITGTMANNGAIRGTIDGITTTVYSVPVGYHNGNGAVSLTDDIENALSAI